MIIIIVFLLEYNRKRSTASKKVFKLRMSLCCSYTNTTAIVQIARIADLPNRYFERVVFPGVCLLFEAPADAHLEIHTGIVVSSIVSDRIPCDRLAFGQENRLVVSTASTVSQEE